MLTETLRISAVILCCLIQVQSGLVMFLLVQSDIVPKELDRLKY